MRALLALAVRARVPAGVRRGGPAARQGRHGSSTAAAATVVLHGVNVAYKVAPYHPNGTAERTSFDREDVARLRSAGA